MTYTTEDFKQGKVIAKNDGNLKMLNKLLKICAPDDYETDGGFKFYKIDNGNWNYTHDVSDLPTQNVSDFFNHDIKHEARMFIKKKFPNLTGLDARACIDSFIDGYNYKISSTK